MLVPLSQLQAGAHGVVGEIRGGATFSGRLAAMGLTPGARVEVLQNAQRGPMLVRARGTRLALGRGEALKILVHAGSDDEHE